MWWRPDATASPSVTEARKAASVRLRYSRSFLVAAVLLSAAPLTITHGGGLAVSTAECSAASCCPETRSICLIGDNAILNRYYISEGTCVDPKQPLPPP
jgi:hypothetical protein